MAGKIAICFFGIVPRSIRYNYLKIVERIIKPLEDAGYSCDIFKTNLELQKNIIDGVKIDPSDFNIIRSDFFCSEKQSDVDHLITRISRKININYCKNVSKINNWNSFRCMYSENMVSRLLEGKRGNYDCVIIYSADYYPLNKINLDHVSLSITNKCVYFSHIHRAGGHTDGFYIGPEDLIIKITGRFNIIEELIALKPTSHENILKFACDKYDIKCELTDFVFCKIRASKLIFLNFAYDVAGWITTMPEVRMEIEGLCRKYNMTLTKKI